jgi:uncharacterized protein YegL
VNIAHYFETPDYFQPSTFTTTGDTPMGAAIEQGLDLLRERKNAYRSNGIAYYRPWITLQAGLTDGTSRRLTMTSRKRELAWSRQPGPAMGSFSRLEIVLRQRGTN